MKSGVGFPHGAEESDLIFAHYLSCVMGYSIFFQRIGCFPVVARGVKHNLSERGTKCREDLVTWDGRCVPLASRQKIDIVNRSKNAQRSKWFKLSRLVLLYNKSLNDCFPRIILGKQNSLFPSGPVIKCLLFVVVSVSSGRFSQLVFTSIFIALQLKWGERMGIAVALYWYICLQVGFLFFYFQSTHSNISPLSFFKCDSRLLFRF